MLIGYARISTLDQNIDLQKDALLKAGCEKIFTDTASGKLAERPALNQLKDVLRKGDTLIIWRLDRLGRNLKDLIEWIGWLEKEGVAIKSLQESLDTATPAGKLIFHVFGAVAEFERNLIRERTMAGLEAARSRGKKGGRKPSLTEEKKDLLLKMYFDTKTPIQTLCETFSISKQTLYNYTTKITS